MKLVNTFLLIILLVVVSFGCKSQQPKNNAVKEVVKENLTSEKKNILFIAIDDLKPLLSNYGETQMHTPNFDRLADMGMTFTNAHVQQAVCGPSRASVMTGTYPDKSKVWDLHTDFRESAPELVSMPEYLISQGYESTGTGKIYHQPSAAPGHDAKTWSIPHDTAKDFDSSYGSPALGFYQNPETKRLIDKYTNEAKDEGKKKFGQIRKYVMSKHKPSTESYDIEDEAYNEGMYTKIALKKLEQLEAKNKPWFLAVGYQKPHLPFVAPKKYWDVYKRDEIKLAEFQELSDGTPSFAYHSFGELRSYTDIDSDLKIGDRIPEDKQRELIHGYMACVSYVDAQIGKLLDALEDKGELENTVIVLWGDHGFHLGDHTEWCKHSNFEQATRIPFMFAGPGVAKKQKSHHPVNLVDLFPTVFDLAGVSQSNQTDGKSLLPLLDNDAKTTIDMDYAISQYPRHGNRMGYALRTERYRYTEWHNNGYKSFKPYSLNNIEAKELYDYEKDPLETRNLVDDPKYKSVVEQLHLKLKTHLNQQYNSLNN